MAAPNNVQNTVPDELSKSLTKYNQTHLIKYKDDLSNEEWQSLLNQISSIDFEHINNLYLQACGDESKDETKKDKISAFPLDNQFNLDKLDEKESKTVKNNLNVQGLTGIYNGKCGVIILAGGQGTRLGSKDPKGLYNIGLPSNKPIFQLHFEKAIKVKQLAFEFMKNNKNNNNSNKNIANAESIQFPLYIMTSPNTHSKTEEFLIKNNYFGYVKEQIIIFSQETYPCLNDKTGKIIMSDKNKIEMSPNGNGGIYTTLENKGILDKMIKNGIEYVQVFGIDNVLAKIGDPIWFGHCFNEKVDISNKTCQKTNPSEKIGTMCLRNGKPSVIEYSEITQEMAHMRLDKNDKNSDLVYGCGNLAMHAFSVSFLKQVVDKEKGFLKLLPIHVAIKKIPYYDEKTNKTITQFDEPNGMKLEYFIFDTFMFANKITTFNILRSKEFAPVKNAKGSDSPQTAREAISSFWKNIVKTVTSNNVKFEGNENDLFEVSNLISYDGEGDELINKTKGKTFKLPCVVN